MINAQHPYDEENMRKPTFDEISSFNEYRANHVALVQKLGRAALDMDFSDHDNDKIEATGKDQELLTLRFLDKKGKIKVSDEDKNTLRKVSANHALNSKHHAEYWDTEINIRNFNEEDKNIIHATNMPKRYIAEMACDWSACALYHNEPIFKWFNKVINKYLFFTDNQIEYLEDCLKKIVKAIGKESISFPGVRYTATQVPPKDWKKEKLEEASNGLESKAKQAFEDEIIKGDNLNLKVFKKNTANKELFSAIVKPTDSKTREEHKTNILNKNIEIDPEKDDFQITKVEDINDVQADKLGAKFGTGTSSNTPIVLLDFENPVTTEFFQVALGFKPKSGESSAAPTEVTEPLEAEAICAEINLGDCSYMMNKEVPELKEGSAEGWLRTSVNTARALVNSDFICKDTRYVVSRGDKVFFEKDGKVVIDKTFEGISSIHKLISRMPFTRKDIFVNISSKDAWNPADIYLIKENKYESIYRSLDKILSDYTIVSKEQVNSALLDLALENNDDGGRDLVGVSLKKLQKGSLGHLASVNYSQDYTRNAIEIEPFIEEPTGSITIPDLEVLPLDSPNHIGVGIYFSCNTKDNHDNYKSVKYTYRAFETDSIVPQMELVGSPGSARIGKTPVSLINLFKSESNLSLDWENMDLRNSRDYSKWSRSQVNNLASDEMLNKIQVIERTFKTSNDVNIPLTVENWKRYVSELERMNYHILTLDTPLDEKKKNLRVVEILRWPKIIDLLYALSVSKSKGKESFETDLSRIYNWSKKEGPDFAPYILIH